MCVCVLGCPSGSNNGNRRASARCALVSNDGQTRMRFVWVANCVLTCSTLPRCWLPPCVWVCLCVCVSLCSSYMWLASRCIVHKKNGHKKSRLVLVKKKTCIYKYVLLILYPTLNYNLHQRLVAKKTYFRHVVRHEYHYRHFFAI